MKPLLLAPVQDFTSLHAAIDAGADAVYFGIKGLNMRAGAKNFDKRHLAKIVHICHGKNHQQRRVLAYLALNVLIYDDEINRVKAILTSAKKAGIDAIICWDAAVIQQAVQIGLETHLSTQASVSNYASVQHYAKVGVKQIVLARELSLKQIKAIIAQIKKDRLGVAIETFIHGAMCVSVSGRCFMSQYLFGKSANRGECLQPCRRKYLIKDPEENAELILGEDYVISPKDLCTMDIIEELIDAGISCFKIEGRNRSPEYVKKVTACYRVAIDLYDELKRETKTHTLETIRLPKETKDELKKVLATVYHRGFSTGFFMGKPMHEWSQSYGSKATARKVQLGKVLNFYTKNGVMEILLQSSPLKRGDAMLVQGPTTGVQECVVHTLMVNHKSTQSAKKGERVCVQIPFKARKNDKVFLMQKVAKTTS